MRLRPGLLAASTGSLIVAAAAAVAVAASAAGAPVVLIGSFDDEPLTGRIAAELRALGIGIEIRVVPTDEQNIDEVVATALRDGARAAVRVDARTGRTEVSIPDPATRQVTLKQVLEGPPTAALVPVLAVRTVEFVRATLLGPRSEDGLPGTGGGSARDAAGPDGQLAAGPSGPNVPTDLSMAQLAGLRLSLASGALFTPGGLTTTYTLGVSVRVRLLPQLGLEAMGFAPLSEGSVAVDQLAANASTWAAGAGAFWHLPVASRASLELGAGGLLANLRVVGAASPTEMPGRDSATAMSGYARGGVDLALTHNLALRLDLLGGVVFQRAVFKRDMVDSSVKLVGWSRTFAAALGGVEARWF